MRYHVITNAESGETEQVPFSAEEEAARDAEEAANVIIPTRVSARQFKMQLVIAGLKAAVDTWVSQQSQLVQMAYEYSGEFVRDEAMMQAGFQALGFTREQGDAFFAAASEL